MCIQTISKQFPGRRPSDPLPPCRLSRDLKVACSIFQINMTGVGASLEDVITRLDRHMTREDVITAVGSLIQAGSIMVKDQKYYVTMEDFRRVRRFYEDSWKGMP